MKHRALILVLAAGLAAPSVPLAGKDQTAKSEPQAQAGESDDTRRVRDAAAVIQEFAGMKEGPPYDLVRNASAVVVIPRLMKAGFGIGGKHGSGVLCAKNADDTWGQPVFIKLTGGSFGWQIGVSSTDLVLILMNNHNIDEILDGEFTVGGDANVAAGPVGRQGSASVDAHFDAEIYSYSRSKGLFAGIAIDGSRLYVDRDAVARVYGDGSNPHEVIAKPPAGGSAGETLAAALKDLTGEKKAEGAAAPAGE